MYTVYEYNMICVVSSLPTTFSNDKYNRQIKHAKDSVENLILVGTTIWTSAQQRVSDVSCHSAIMSDCPRHPDVVLFATILTQIDLKIQTQKPILRELDPTPDISPMAWLNPCGFGMPQRLLLCTERQPKTLGHHTD